VSFIMPQPASVLRSLDLARLDALARTLVDRVPRGTTFGLVGTLGAGKTSLVRAIAQACGVDVADVTSPTFTLLQTHRGSLTIHHLDAYRLADEDEFLELGVEELFADNSAWTLVEWADRVAGVMPAATLWLRIDIEPSDIEPGDIGNDSPETGGHDHDEPLRSVTMASTDPSLAGFAKEIVSDLA
jgi:tRNA threonylcarbamoyladenosine biosynthesis protein TsaE